MMENTTKVRKCGGYQSMLSNSITSHWNEKKPYKWNKIFHKLIRHAAYYLVNASRTIVHNRRILESLWDEVDFSHDAPADCGWADEMFAGCSHETVECWEDQNWAGLIKDHQRTRVQTSVKPWQVLHPSGSKQFTHVQRMAGWLEFNVPFQHKLYQRRTFKGNCSASYTARWMTWTCAPCGILLQQPSDSNWIPFLTPPMTDTRRLHKMLVIIYHASKSWQVLHKVV